MATTTFTCNKDARIAESGDLGAGASDFNPVGLYSGYKYRTLLGFSYSFAGMVSITSAVLHLRTSTQYYVAFGSDPDINVRRLSGSWSEGSSSGLSGSNAVTWSNQPGSTGTSHQGDISTSESTWDTVDITTLMQEALAANDFDGLQIRAVDEGTASDVTEFYSREQGSSDAYITVTYTTNVAPTTPTGVTPTASALMAGVTPTLQATHVDADGDALLKYDIQVSTDSTFAGTKVLDAVNQTSGIVGNNIDRVYNGTALTRGTVYYFRIRTYSAAGILTASPWSATGSFKPNRLPTVTFVVPSAVDANVELQKVAGSGVNPRMVVRWAFADPDGAAQKTYQVTVLTDASGAFHTSAVYTSTATSYVVPVDVVRGAFYRVTVTVTDSLGESANTGSRRCKANWSVTEYRRDLGGTVTKWSASIVSAGGTNKAVVAEYASSSGGAAITTWYSSIGGAALGRWFHWRVWLFAWSGATTPSVTQMAMSYTTSTAVPPDGWTITSQYSLDAGTRVYGTQSLKAAGNAAAQSAYQKVYIEPNTDYILSGRIKSDGASMAAIYISTAGTGGAIVGSPVIGASQDWTAVKTPVWNSGANSYIYVRCVVQGAAGTYAWFDALKMEASLVVTPWTPGFIGPALSIDAGGIQVDAKAGGIFRLQASLGSARETVELADKGLMFGTDVQVYSPFGGALEVSGQVRSLGNSGFVVVGAANSLRHFLTAVDTQPVLTLSTSVISFGIGGTTAPDVTLSREAAQALTVWAGLTLGGGSTYQYVRFWSGTNNNDSFLIDRGTGGTSVARLIPFDAAAGAYPAIQMQAVGGAARIGFFGTLPVVKPAITGARASNVALTNLLAALATMGLITNSTTT